MYYPENFRIGKRVDVGVFTSIFCQHGVFIEDDVQIGGHCLIYSENTINETEGPVFIRRGARIGAFSLILPNAVIEEYSFHHAFSLIKGEK